MAMLAARLILMMIIGLVLGVGSVFAENGSRFAEFMGFRLGMDLDDVRDARNYKNCDSDIRFKEHHYLQILCKPENPLVRRAKLMFYKEELMAIEVDFNRSDEDSGSFTAYRAVFGKYGDPTTPPVRIDPQKTRRRYSSVCQRQGCRLTAWTDYREKAEVLMYSSRNAQGPAALYVVLFDRNLHRQWKKFRHELEGRETVEGRAKSLKEAHF